MKKTLYSCCINKIQHPLQDGVILGINYNKVIEAIHVDKVAAAISSLPPNKVLGYPPPEINASEESLPRVHRTTLFQLRSLYCIHLKTYLHSIGRSDIPDCPECGLAPHTTNHLFDCPSFPTDLVVVDLWSRPCVAAAFVSSLPSFSHLPPVVLPLLRPPPEPDPAGISST
jgi:hypothetical protein